MVGKKLADHEVILSKTVETVHAPRTLHGKLLFQAVATLMAACLVMGLVIAETVPEGLHDVSRMLSAHTNSSQNVSAPKLIFMPLPGFGTLPPVSTQGVNTLCMCNLSPMRVYMIIDAPAPAEGYHWRAGGDYVWNGRPCDCMSAATFQKYTREGGTIRCSFRRESDEHYTEHPCSGSSFTYQSTSRLSGRYAFSGSPPTCAYSGYCSGSACLRTY